MDRSNIEMAARLLGKAQTTDSEAEMIALVEKSYRLLARSINAFDSDQPRAASRARRRERRLVQDRRAARRASAAEAFAPQRPSVEMYGQLRDPVDTRDHIDLIA
jgi:hypothetical protein